MSSRNMSAERVVGWRKYRARRSWQESASESCLHGPLLTVHLTRRRPNTCVALMCQGRDLCH